jgi:hypothetical protein
MINNNSSNSRLLLCSKDMHIFMEANDIQGVNHLFEISLHDLVLMPDFPYRLLKEWVSLRDKYNLLCEN